MVLLKTRMIQQGTSGNTEVQYEVKDKVRWIVYDDEPERTGIVYEADHEIDYYFIKVDLKKGETVQMSCGMPGKSILGLVEPVSRDGNVISFTEFKTKNGALTQKS